MLLETLLTDRDADVRQYHPLHALARCLMVMFLASLASGCKPDAQSTVDTVPENPFVDLSESSDSVAHLPFTSANYLMVDDINADGLGDVVLVSHGGNVAQAFVQSEDRLWTAGPQFMGVGFHPGEIKRLSSETEQPRYLLFAEGDRALRILEPTEDNTFEIVGQSGTPYPRAGTLFNGWPGWDLGVAFSPYSRPSIGLIRNFDTETALGKGVEEIGIIPAHFRVESISAADIDGDGIDEILFMNSFANTLKIVRHPDETDTPTAEDLWVFKNGGHARYVVPADLDQDGDLDLLVPHELSQRPKDLTVVDALINEGQGQWTNYSISVPAPKRGEGGEPGIAGFGYGIDEQAGQYALAAGQDRLTLINFPAGWPANPETMQQVMLPSSRDRFPMVELKDIDSDGHLDAVLARTNKDYGALVLYGPLKDTFAKIGPSDLATPSTLAP